MTNSILDMMAFVATYFFHARCDVCEGVSIITSKSTIKESRRFLWRHGWIFHSRFVVVCPTCIDTIEKRGKHIAHNDKLNALEKERKWMRRFNSE